MKTLRTRKKKIDVEKMSAEELQNLEQALSEKMRCIIQDAIKKANKYLTIYDLEAYMAFELKPLKKTDNLKDI